MAVKTVVGITISLLVYVPLALSTPCRPSGCPTHDTDDVELIQKRIDVESSLQLDQGTSTATKAQRRAQLLADSNQSKAPCDWTLDPACGADDPYCSCLATNCDSHGYFIKNAAHFQCKPWCLTHPVKWTKKCDWSQCAACPGSKEANTGCCISSTTTTTVVVDLDKANKLKKAKNGLICGEDVCLHAFKAGVSWHYNYNLLIDDDTAELLNENAIEFVPMSDRPVEWSTAAGKSCTWVVPQGGWSPTRQCDVNTIIDSVQLTNSKLTGKSKAKYLMMFNEAYLSCDSSQCQGSYIKPQDLAEVWRKYFIPAAKELGLDLVSPTFKGDEEKYQTWAANVLAECYKLRDEQSHPCDIHSLKRLSVHAYQCSENFYIDYYTRDGPYSWKNDLMIKLETILGSDYDSASFGEFFDNTPVWVTEMSCASDKTYSRYPNGFKDSYGYGQAPYDQQCLRASGQEPASHGKGLFKTLTDMSEIERFAWFGLVVASDFKDTYVGAGNNVITQNGVVMPTGKLLITNYSELAALNCSMPSGADGSGDGNGGTDNPDKGI